MKRKPGQRGPARRDLPAELRDQFLSVSQAAELLGCHYTTVFRLLLWKHELPAFKLGSEWRIRRSDLEAWIERQTTSAPAEPLRAKAKTRKYFH